MNIDIHAITVCVNYAHLLKYSIIANKHFFKRWVIVTTQEDHQTQELCKEHNLECLISKTIRQRTFFKSGAINEAFEYLGYDKEWYLHIDADVILPQNFDEVFAIDKTGEPQIRGRQKVKSPNILQSTHTSKFRKYINKPHQHAILYCMGRVNVDKNENIDNLNIQKYFDRTDEIVQEFKGYGYFQLFNLPAFFKKYKNHFHQVYPTMSRNAGSDDWVFSKLFDKIVSLETYCIHLSPEEVNWNGIESSNNSSSKLMSSLN
jgi:hypothetical protein